MASSYIFNENPYYDILLRIMMSDGDISKPEQKPELHRMFKYILESYLENPNDSVRLDFDIKEDDIKYTFIPNNIATALWVTGIVIDDIDYVMKNNECYIDGGKFTFNPKTKILKFTKKHE